jgi:CHASE2 domain-containing sensor protein/serine/threonine protein kinase
MLEILLNGRYRIIQVLGSGGFGQTYIAEDLQQPDHRKCVVKQFKPSRQDERFLRIARRLFASEVETLRKLGSHSQIPSLLDDFEENQEFYLVQEYIEGRLLSDELAAGRRMNEAEVLTMLYDVLHILEFVHQNQVIHRDIKPGNLIQRTCDGRYVLIDFGAVKEIQTQLTPEPGQTNLTVGIGTQGYGPSEQLMGKPRYNSDLYALGMTAIHALTGLQPAQLPTHPETGEVVWVDETEVSPKLAAILTRMTRYHFSQRYQSATEVLEALDSPPEVVLNQPTEVPSDQPTEVWTDAVEDTTRMPDTQVAGLPVRASKYPPFKSARLSDRRPGKRAPVSIVIGVASFLATGFVLGVRHLGWLQPLELAVFDRLVQISPALEPDPRLLVVAITEADIQKHGFPVPDGVLTQALQKLKPHQPGVIGLDLLRDRPQADLKAELSAPNIIAITRLGNSDTPATPPPPGMPEPQVGFNDLVLDPDGVVRRNLMFADYEEKTFYSFSLRLALRYLAERGIRLTEVSGKPEAAQLGKSLFQPLRDHSGGYQTIDDRGYQVLLRYRGRNPVQQVSLEQVLTGQINPTWIRDRIVLIGTTASSGKDLFFTPYSSSERDVPKMSGVMLHATMVSQFLDAALAGRSLFWFWPEWIEVIWIATWAVGGAVLAWYRRPTLPGATGVMALLVLGGIGFGIFTQMGWVPIVAPAVATIASGWLVLAYRGLA